MTFETPAACDVYVFVQVYIPSPIVEAAGSLGNLITLL